MPKKTPELFSYFANDPEFVPDPEIEEFMEEEIAHAPKDPDLLAQRLRNHAASPADSGGDIEADWLRFCCAGEWNARRAIGIALLTEQQIVHVFPVMG